MNQSPKTSSYLDGLWTGLFLGFGISLVIVGVSKWLG